MSVATRLRPLVTLLLLALLLVGCAQSSLETFTAPTSVDAQETFQATVTHQWQDDTVADQPDPGLTSADLVFVMGLPVGWEIGNTIAYAGTFAGNPLALTLERQPGEGIPDNFREFLIADGGDQSDIDLYDQFSCSEVPPSVPDELNLVFFRATTPFPGIEVTPPEGGTFTFELTAGSQAGDFTLVAAHGTYATLDNTGGNGPNPVTSCTFFVEQTGDLAPAINIITADVAAMGGAAPRPDAVPVPVGGAWLVVLTAVALLGTGLWFGRRRSRRNDR